MLIVDTNSGFWSKKGGKIEAYPQLKQKNFADLTFNQFMALMLLFSAYEVENRSPSKEEIKKIIGTKSDRMLEITLIALEKKGFICFNGLSQIPVAEIPEENKPLSSLFTDRLMVTTLAKTYKELKKEISEGNVSISKASQNNFYFQPSFTTDLSTTEIRELNNLGIVHRWYNLLQDFSPLLVWDKLESYGIQSGETVLDPFVGGGTTAITAKMKGINCKAVDINSVSSFVTSIKSNWNINLAIMKKEIDSVCLDFAKAEPCLEEFHLKTEFKERMPKKELDQWLKPTDQNKIAYLKERIKEIKDKGVREVILLALIASAVEASNVAFCPGTTFYPFRKRDPFSTAFLKKLSSIYQDLWMVQHISPEKGFGKVDVFNDDCRSLSKFINEPIDFIFTSPPYPNDLEYTRQTRLELYLLDFVRDMEDVRKIKRKMVKGSTKLIFEESNSSQYVEDFESIKLIAQELERALSDKKWGWNYPRMIQEYFGDIFLTLVEFKKVLRERAYALLVVGDQTYKHILIPVGKLICELAKEAGFSFAGLENLRTRRSTIHNIPLKEEIVVLRR